MTIHHLVNSVDVVFALRVPEGVEPDYLVCEKDYSLTHDIVADTEVMGFEPLESGTGEDLITVVVRARLSEVMALDIIREELSEADYLFVFDGGLPIDSEMREVLYAGDGI